MLPEALSVNNTGSICTDSLRHGNGLSALLTAQQKVALQKAARLKHAPWKAGFMQGTLAKQRPRMGNACQSGTVATLLNSLFSCLKFRFCLITESNIMVILYMWCSSVVV